MRGEVQDGFGEAQHDPAHRRALIECRLTQRGVHAQRGYRTLHDELAIRYHPSEQSGHPDHPLRADHADFDRRAVRHIHQDGGQPLLDKIDVFERRADLVDDVPQREGNWVEVRKKPLHIFFEQRREKAVLESFMSE